MKPFRFLNDAEFFALSVDEKFAYLARYQQEQQEALRAQMFQLGEQEMGHA